MKDGWIKRVGNFLSDLLYVPRCVGCDRRMPPGGDLPLCPSCGRQYRDEREVTCPVCAGRMGDCLCMPASMPRCGVHRMLKLARYEVGRDDVSAKLIFTLKHRGYRKTVNFLAKEMAVALRAGMPDLADFLVTAVPRSRAGIHRDGFDHAAALGHALARELELPYLVMVRRVPGHDRGQQKDRSRAERIRTAGADFMPAPGADVKGKRFLLVDDVATTGATLSACARCLRKGGAKEVVFAVLAKTADKTKAGGKVS